MRLRFLLLAGLVFLSGCAFWTDDNKELDSHARLSTLFYGTDRTRNQIDKLDHYYGNKRGELEYGRVQVVVPDGKGKVRLEKILPDSRMIFLEELDRAVQSSPSPTVFVFIHGYNRSFSQVSKLVAEFSEEVQFEGVPVFWTWPSTHNPAAYVEDQNNLYWSRTDFASFLGDIIMYSGAETIHLLGHSMGAEGLVNVILYELIPMDVDISRIGEFVLLAPDIDSEIFERDMAPALVESGLKVTLYTSSNDKAMASSRVINGYPRAGDSSDGPVLVEGVETIDVTAANRSVLGHSYFEESADVGKDLGELINKRWSASRRSQLISYQNPNGIYWRLLYE